MNKYSLSTLHLNNLEKKYIVTAYLCTGLEEQSLKWRARQCLVLMGLCSSKEGQIIKRQRKIKNGIKRPAAENRTLDNRTKLRKRGWRQEGLFSSLCRPCTLWKCSFLRTQWTQIWMKNWIWPSYQHTRLLPSLCLHFGSSYRSTCPAPGNDVVTPIRSASHRELLTLNKTNKQKPGWAVGGCVSLIQGVQWAISTHHTDLSHCHMLRSWYGTFGTVIFLNLFQSLALFLHAQEWTFREFGQHHITLHGRGQWFSGCGPSPEASAVPGP